MTPSRAPGSGVTADDLRMAEGGDTDFTFWGGFNANDLGADLDEAALRRAWTRF